MNTCEVCSFEFCDLQKDITFIFLNFLVGRLLGYQTLALVARGLTFQVLGDIVGSNVGEFHISRDK